jgi:deoxyhypusine synthase
MRSIDVASATTLADLLRQMSHTSTQGRALGCAFELLERMVDDPRVTIFMGAAGSLAAAGQALILRWFVDRGFVDVLVATGANISEDLVEALGLRMIRRPPDMDDRALRDAGYNRLYDVCVTERDYVRMTEVIADFMSTLKPETRLSSRRFLQHFGQWLGERGVGSIVSAAAARGVPIFSPALLDSAYGDAALLTHRRGLSFTIDAVQDHVEFMSLDVDETAAVYLGGGVPKDFIQTFAVSTDFLRGVPDVLRRRGARRRGTLERVSCAHKYSVQITADAPQWGGSSGASLAEGVSWGKQAPGPLAVDCYCDLTIALPFLAHALAQAHPRRRANRNFGLDYNGSRLGPTSSRGGPHGP